VRLNKPRWFTLLTLWNIDLEPGDRTTALRLTGALDMQDFFCPPYKEVGRDPQA